MAGSGVRLVLILLLFRFYAAKSDQEQSAYEDEDWGDGLRVLTTYRPDNCEHRARQGDVIHYHYVGRLGSNGEVFGKSFDYDSPYIVSLGHGRIIAGMDRGLMGTCLWERRRITVPPHLGYGERGVGSVIPGNSTLMFYIRMIKIERNGYSLGEEVSMEDMWNAGLHAYGQGNWADAVEMIEKSLELFSQYQNEAYHCLKKCKQTVPKLSSKEKEVVESISGSNKLVGQFVKFAGRNKCIRDCKREKLSPKLQSPDRQLLEKFRQRLPFSYLHYSYYQQYQTEDGARCLFTYCAYNDNPDPDICSKGSEYYRMELNLRKDEYLYREPGQLPHHSAYLEGKKLYEEENWLESTEAFERALGLYKEALGDCLLLCEDIVNLDLSQEGIGPQKLEKFDDYQFVVDSMEFYPLMTKIMKEVLNCSVSCHNRTATVHGVMIDKYLLSHFHYLQFNYYKIGMTNKAAEAAATYLALEPSDEVMASNIRFYISNLKVSPENFTPWKEYVTMGTILQTEETLLDFAVTGKVAKKKGVRGDPAMAPLHQEL